MRLDWFSSIIPNLVKDREKNKKVFSYENKFKIINIRMLKIKLDETITTLK